jgi:hypothetical protein
MRSRWAPAASSAGAARRRAGDTRHPLVAVAMALPGAVLLAVVFGGWHPRVVRAQSVAALIGR